MPTTTIEDLVAEFDRCEVSVIEANRRKNIAGKEVEDFIRSKGVTDYTTEDGTVLKMRKKKRIASTCLEFRLPKE